MNMITDFFKLDLPSFIISIFLVLSAIIAIVNITGKFSEIIGKPVKWIQRKNSDHDLLVKTASGFIELSKQRNIDVEQSMKHDKALRNDISSVSNKVNEISEQISYMQKKIDETEMAKLKDTLITYYRKYKDIGEWSQLEHDAFWDLFKSYESHGGNGFMHSTVEPTMREINIVEN